MIKYNGKDIIPRIDGKELSRVMYNGKQIYPINNKSLIGNVADYVLYDKLNNKKIIVPYNTDLTIYPVSQYTPIGIVIIPTSHDVYGTGECGIMSLKPMNCNTPLEGGTSDQSMYWGVSGTNISELPDLDKVPIGNTSDGIPTSQNSYGYLPSDKFNTLKCNHNTNIFYSSARSIPSPYLTDGTRNPGYYQTTPPSSSRNALADFDGKGNTQKIITQRGAKDYNSWKPTSNLETDYPAASCCDMFHTEGTLQGDWYLPSMGELGYMIIFFNKINNAIHNIQTIYGSSIAVKLDNNIYRNYYYWSSTECSNNSVYRINTNNAFVEDNDKNYGNYVRAWLKMSIT